MKKPADITLKQRILLVHREKTGKTRRKPTNEEKKNVYRYKHYSKHKQIAPKIIELPSNFSLHTNTNKTLEIMNQFREVVDEKSPKLNKLSFATIEYINSSSALMLAAEVDVWNIKVSHKLHSEHNNWEKEVKILLCQMGFFDLLGIPSPRSAQLISINTIFLKFISGSKSEGKKAQELRKCIEKVVGTKLEKKMHLFEGISEAFTNTTQHAYDPDNSHDFDKWWLSAS